MSQNPETEDLFKVLQCNGFNICDKYSFKHVAELSFQAAAVSQEVLNIYYYKVFDPETILYVVTGLSMQ